MQTILLGNVVPDKEQPRKYFDANKMLMLRENIKKNGIKVPLVVQDMGNGKFLLIDGERRHRVATELKLKEVPVVVEKPTSEIERLVTQFSIQEQHEGWTPTEKANAIIAIAKQMGTGLKDTMTLLNIPADASRRYMAFSLLADKQGYQNSQVPMDYVTYVLSLRNAAARLSEDNNFEFTCSDEKKLERKVVELISRGEIRKRADLTKIKDSFVKQPKLIRKFLDTSMTVEEAYREAKAKGAYHLRNAFNSSQYVISHGDNFLDLKDVRVTDKHVVVFKHAIETLKKLIALAE